MRKNEFWQGLFVGVFAALAFGLLNPQAFADVPVPEVACGDLARDSVKASLTKPEPCLLVCADPERWYACATPGERRGFPFACSEDAAVHNLYSSAEGQCTLTGEQPVAVKPSGGSSSGGGGRSSGGFSPAPEPSLPVSTTHTLRFDTIVPAHEGEHTPAGRPTEQGQYKLIDLADGEFVEVFQLGHMRRVDRLVTAYADSCGNETGSFCDLLAEREDATMLRLRWPALSGTARFDVLSARRSNDLLRCVIGLDWSTGGFTVNTRMLPVGEPEPLEVEFDFVPGESYAECRE